MTRPLTAAEIPTLNSATTNGRSVQLMPASKIFIRPVRWLWDLRIALATLVLIGGREGIGKTICAFTIAADITRGRLKGVFLGTARAVIIAATEDSWEHTIVPRLMAAGADLDLVFRVDVTTSTGIDTALSLPRDLVELEAVIREVNAALVILDPLMSRLDGALDTHKDSEVRLALEPLVALADRSGATVAGIIHVNKSTSTDALTTLMGSRAFAAVARSVLFVMLDPDDERTRLLGQPKNNLGSTDLPTLRFTIEPQKVADTLEGPVWTGRLVWTGESDRSIRDALESAAVASVDRSATSEAQDWLHDYLVQHDGSAESAAVKRDGAKAGHSKDALRRAGQRLNLRIMTAGFPRRSVWSLAAGDKQESPRPSCIGARSGRVTTTAPNASTAPTGETHQIEINQLASVDAVSAVNAVNAALQDEDADAQRF